MKTTGSFSSLIALLVAGTFFMENLDGTVIVTALPQMARSFGVHPVDLNVGVSSYILTLAVFIPASGWIADRFGARKVFASAIVMFTLTSVLCGLSEGLASFTAARILQGAGGAMMVPVGRLVVLRNTEKDGLIRAISTITWPGLIAPVLGPPLGGFITTYASWHWIFFLNLPLGLVALGLALVFVPKESGGERRPFDHVGFLLTGFACFGIVYGLDLVSRTDESWLMPAALVSAGVAIGALALRHVRRRAHPLIELWAFQLRSYLVSVVGGSMFRISIGAIPFLLPLLFQVGFGLDAFTSGLLVLAVFAGNLAMKLVTTPILRRVRFRVVLLVSGLINAATTFACALLSPTTPIPLIVALLFVSGLSRSMQFTSLNTLAFADVPKERMSGANTFANMAQQMAMGLGVAIGAVALRIAGLIFPHSGGAMPLSDFRIAFMVVGAFALLAVADVFTLPPDAGDNIRRRGGGR